MSFQVYLISEIFLVVFLSCSRNVIGSYENNPFLQGENRPVHTSPTNKPLVTQSPVTQLPVILSSSQQTSTTKEPIFTIEPPEILYGNDLHRKCLKPSGQFPSNSCNTYVNCWQGVAVEQKCLGNFLFNSVKLYCDYPENVDCQGRSITRTTPTPQAINSVISTTSSDLNPTQAITSNPVSPAILDASPSLRKYCLRSTGLFPGSTCSKFINCWEDNAVEQDCPPGLHFSSEGFCDYPENVYCNNQNNNVETPARVQRKGSDCPLEFGNFRNRNNCSQYYTCAYYKVAAKYNCPEGLSFSDILGICDYSYRVDCSKEPQIFQKNSNNLQGIHVRDNDCPLEFGNFRNRTNCSQYYTCAFYKVAAKYDCPTGFSFSDLLGICDYSYRTDCTKEPQLFEKNSNNEQGYEFPFNAFAHPDLSFPVSKESPCTVRNGLVRDRDNCSSYYLCEFGKIAANYVCPDGFKFNTELGVCDYEEKVNCNSPSKAFEIGSTNMIVPNVSNEILSQVQRCIPGSVFRLNPQCTSACRCRNGAAEIIQCSAGLAYDSKTDKCVLAHLARC